jgi:hypothetical protein
MVFFFNIKQTHVDIFRSFFCNLFAEFWYNVIKLYYRQVLWTVIEIHHGVRRVV